MLAAVLGFVFFAVRVPVGTELQIRLTERISTETARAGQPVEAVAIAPVLAGGAVAIPAHAELSGTVKSASPANPAAKEKASLALSFSVLKAGGQTLQVETVVSGVDNAREAVGEDGTIQGLAPSEMLTARIDQGLSKLEQRFSGLAGILEAAKGAFIKDADPNIVYEAGAEMSVKLLKAVEIAPSGGPDLRPFPNDAALGALVNRQPFQTYAVKPAVKSDIANLMFIGSRQALVSAFEAAGWSNAAALNDRSKMRTAQAIIEQRGYREAPVSLLILDDRPPDLVYEKGNNTFAARHHLRIWRSPDDFMGQPVWISSSTHDTGIDFSQESMTFIHKIDPNIDAERAKVVNDLLFAGSVRSLALAPRPRVPQHARNATGDGLDTDGAMAVMLLR